MRAAELSVDKLNGNIFVVEGQDAYWQRCAVNFFMGLVPEEYKAFNLHVIDNLNSLADISEAQNTISMFFDVPTVIIVKDSEYKEAAADKDELKKILSSDFNGYLVLVNASFLNAAAKKKLMIIDANRYQSYELKHVITKIENKIENDAIELLIEYTQSDMEKITNELKKLGAFTEGKRKITAEDVINLVPNTVENDIFVLTEAIASGNRLKAHQILDRFMARGVPTLLIIATLTGTYRRMLHSQLSKKTDLELSKDLGVKEFAIKKTRALAKKYTKKQLKACLDALIDAEYGFKSGLTAENSAFKCAITKLMTV